MKPKDLKCPVTWSSRRPLLHEGVLFVPPYYDRHDEWQKLPWSDASLFGNDHPVSVEYCSGNGDWVIGKALADPSRNWVAVEKRFDRVRKIWSKMRNQSVGNLLIVCGEAQAFTRHYLLPASVQEIFINFPDPWPKRGHAKHRLIQSAFVGEMARVIAPEGSACFVTDDPDYSGQMVHEMTSSSLWKAQFPSPHYVEEWPDYGYSFFDTLWRGKGCKIRYHIFNRCIHAS
jgi:tRNA (guanine-N7-)-methyltransferase